MALHGEPRKATKLSKLRGWVLAWVWALAWDNRVPIRNIAFVIPYSV